MPWRQPGHSIIGLGFRVEGLGLREGHVLAASKSSVKRVEGLGFGGIHTSLCKKGFGV